MKKKLRAAKRGVVPGRIGTKRSDRRWRAPDGTEWDSKFEWQVFDALTKREVGRFIRCERGGSHSVSYSSPVRNASCGACGSDQVSKRRTYTPDLLHDRTGADGKAGAADGNYYIELKGYLRSEERSLLRALCKARPDFDLRFIVQRDWKVSKASGLTIVQWIRKYLKRPVAVWDGKLPNWEKCL